MPNKPDVFIAPKPKRQRAKDTRGGSTKRGYNSKWQVASRAYLRKHPFCTYHQRKGETIAAQVVDHIRPHKGDMKLFWDRDNWQPLCKSCHDRKSATE